MIPKNHHGALEVNTIFKMTRVVFRHVNGFCMEGAKDFARSMRTQWERLLLTGRKNKGLCQDLLSSLDNFKYNLEKPLVGMLCWEFVNASPACVVGWIILEQWLPAVQEFSDAKTVLVVPPCCGSSSRHLVGRGQRCC